MFTNRIRTQAKVGVFPSAKPRNRGPTSAVANLPNIWFARGVAFGTHCSPPFSANMVPPQFKYPPKMKYPFANNVGRWVSIFDKFTTNIRPKPI